MKINIGNTFLAKKLKSYKLQASSGFTPTPNFGVSLRGKRGPASARRERDGFTLIELLVVVAIIGMLLSIISLSLTSSRQKARDTKRISDMKQIKTGMDLFFSTGGGYPDTGAWVVGANLTCGTEQIMRIPPDPGGALYAYAYTANGISGTGCGGTVRGGYSIQFFMERQAAYYTMDEDGTFRDPGNNPVSVDALL
ncbi:MAG: hypothetical protein UY65_C0009G0020 [Parcubacteria group bacterium GW2011_GWA2_51_12]|nr:MAG: hypothetical protein UY65_C0009G0020 [Parcubacteria group bacterium GW2011_GWA2_51_12]